MLLFAPLALADIAFDIPDAPLSAIASWGSPGSTFSLYRAIRARFQQQTLSGISCGLSLADANALHDLTGRYPAVVSLNASAVSDAISYWNRGGVPLLTWHCTASAAAADPSSADYSALIGDVDAVAEGLRSLQKAGVSVLWRPLFRRVSDAAAAKTIWSTVYTRLFVHNRLTNLLWVWSTDAAPGAPAWFPGLSAVDIIGVEAGAGHGARAAEFAAARNIGGGQRMVAIVDCAGAPAAEAMRADGAKWAFFVAPFGGPDNNAEFWKAQMADPLVLDLAGMPGWAA